jgi:hypothetical protein
MRSTNDAVVNGKRTIAGGTAAAAGAATTLQFDRSVAPPKCSGRCHVTMTASLPGMVTATTENGGPGGTTGMEGVGDADSLRRSEQHNNSTQADHARIHAEQRVARAVVAANDLSHMQHTREQTEDWHVRLRSRSRRAAGYTHAQSDVVIAPSSKHCCKARHAHLVDDLIEGDVLSLADADADTDTESEREIEAERLALSDDDGCAELDSEADGNGDDVADNDELLDTDEVAVVVIDTDQDVDDVAVLDIDGDHDVDDVAVLVTDEEHDADDVAVFVVDDVKEDDGESESERDRVGDDDCVDDGDVDRETLLVDDSEAEGVSDGVADEFTSQTDTSNCGSRTQFGG